MQHLKAAALLSGPVFLLLIPAALVGGRLVWWIAGLLAAFVVVLLWRSDTLVLRSLRAEQLQEQAAPGLYAIIRTLAQRQHLPLPAVYLVHSSAPNALLAGNAAGVSRLVLTAGLLQALNSNQLAAVIAHHMSLIESATAFSMTLAAVYALVLDRIPGAGFLESALVRFAVPPSLKFQADADSAHIIGDPGPLVEALKEISAAGPAPSPSALRPLWFCDPTESCHLREERFTRLASLALRPVPTGIL